MCDLPVRAVRTGHHGSAVPETAKPDGRCFNEHRPMAPPGGFEPPTFGIEVVQGRFTRSTVRIHPGRFGEITPYLEESLSDLVRMIPSEADSLDNSWTLLDNRLSGGIRQYSAQPGPLGGVSCEGAGCGIWSTEKRRPRGSVLFDRSRDMTALSLRPFWQSFRSARNVVAVEVNGYEIESGAYLKGAYLKGAYLFRANLFRANLEGANLFRANLEGANLEGAYLTGANLARANLGGVYLFRANLTGANLTFVSLTRAILTRANLTRVNLTGANLTWANLTRVNLTRVNLEGVYLTGANLEGANLEGANLTGANLTGANLTGANLKRAGADEGAIWPEGFDPKAAGVIID